MHPSRVGFILGAAFLAASQLPAAPPHLDICTAPSTGRKGVAAAHKTWPAGQTVAIQFLDGDAATQHRIATLAAEWTQYANLKFRFVFTSQPQEPPSDVRVTLGGSGFWSAVGTDAKNSDLFAEDQPTLGLEGAPTLTADMLRRHTLHEFGHVLGLEHEQQNPTAPIHWNKTAVYEYYQQACGWTTQAVDINVLSTLDPKVSKFTRFDPNSIMLYPIPPEFTLDHYSVGWNKDLSDIDKQTVAKLYPKK